MMKVKIDKVRAQAAIHFDLSGSVLAETIKAGCVKVVTSYEIESTEDEGRVAAVLRNARNGCWVRAAIASPVPFEDSTTLNGRPFNAEDYPAREDRIN